MPDIDPYLQLRLDSTSPSIQSFAFVNPRLSGGTNYNSIPLTITLGSGSTDTTQMLIYGVKAQVTKTDVADGNAYSWEYETTGSQVIDPANVDVKINNQTPGSGVTVDTETTPGTVTISPAPLADDVVTVTYWKKEITATDAVWQTYSASPTIALDRDTVASAGTVTVSLKVRDDVWNESTVATATASVDTTAPIITVTSIVLGDGSYETDPTYKISTIAGRDTLNINFTVNEDIQAWKAVVVQDYGDSATAGTNIDIPQTVPGAATSQTGVEITANTAINCHIKGADLQTAVTNDGDYKIKVFAQDMSGNWSA